MPLLDHFHEPLAPLRHWESFHANWAGSMADSLNERLLPEGYFAEEHAQLGPRAEIDVATFGTVTTFGPAAGNGSKTAVTALTWTPPKPAETQPISFPDAFEVFVFQNEGGASLVAAVELVSPGNKDRPESRRAFAIKCASYIVRGIGLVIVDVVTNRRAKLHQEIMSLLGLKPTTKGIRAANLYGIAYRPIVRKKKELVDIWPFPLAIGQPMPTVPLALNAEIVLPLDLEETYTIACKRRRIA